jgi:pimeloyl-ACP methyl ester carboxylesterase
VNDPKLSDDILRATKEKVYGDKDWSGIPERERTKAALRNARLFTLQNTGHFSSVESPQEVASIILS